MIHVDTNILAGGEAPVSIRLLLPLPSLPELRC